jgi:hypothetical protein
MNDFTLHSTKYDRSLHYRYPVRVVEQSQDRLVTFSEPGVPVESYRGLWPGKQHLLSVFWLNRPYVLHVIWDNAWRPQKLYVDIATGTNWRAEEVGYVDLDLDVVLPHDASEVYVDDEDEFETNRVRWSYPTELVSRCRDAVMEVRGLLEARRPPFTPALFAWRPGVALTL